MLDGRADPALLRGKMVLIGVTAVGLGETFDTPVRQRMSGNEIHSQLLENFLQGKPLRRPAWAAIAEALLLLALGAILVGVAPRWKPVNAAKTRASPHFRSWRADDVEACALIMSRQLAAAREWTTRGQATPRSESVARSGGTRM